MTAPEVKQSPTFGRPGLVLFAGVAFAVPLLYALYTGHIWEDFLITFRFSQNLCEGHGLVYRPGERVYGSTSPLGTLHDALSPAEKDLAKTPEGAAQVQAFHRQLFAASSGSLRQEINRITGMKVCEATAEVEPASGAVVQAFTSGTVVEVFLLGGNVATETWAGNCVQAKERTSSTDGQSQDADRHSKTRHVHSQK